MVLDKLFKRVKEHLSDCRSLRGKKSSHIRDHLKTAHPNINIRNRQALLGAFRMSIINTAKTPLARQLGEVLAIKKSEVKGDNVLNGKEEYTICYIPLSTIEGRKPLPSKSSGNQIATNNP